MSRNVWLPNCCSKPLPTGVCAGWAWGGDVHDQRAMRLGIIPVRGAGLIAEEFQRVLLIALLVLEEPDVDDFLRVLREEVALQKLDRPFDDPDGPQLHQFRGFISHHNKRRLLDDGERRPSFGAPQCALPGPLRPLASDEEEHCRNRAQGAPGAVAPTDALRLPGITRLVTCLRKQTGVRLGFPEHPRIAAPAAMQRALRGGQKMALSASHSNQSTHHMQGRVLPALTLPAGRSLAPIKKACRLSDSIAAACRAAAVPSGLLLLAG